MIDMKKAEFDKYKEILAGTKLFKNMSEQDIWKILKQPGCRVITAEKDEELFFDAAYVILEGIICIEKRAADQRALIMSKAAPPAAINLAAAFSHNGSLSRLFAEERCTALQISGDVIRKAIAAGGTFPLNIMEFLVDRVAFLNKKITAFAGYSSESKLNMYLTDNTENGKVRIASYTELAEVLGVGRASLYRSLDALEAKGVIKRKGRTIEITGEL